MDAVSRDALRRARLALLLAAVCSASAACPKSEASPEVVDALVLSVFSECSDSNIPPRGDDQCLFVKATTPSGEVFAGWAGEYCGGYMCSNGDGFGYGFERSDGLPGKPVLLRCLRPPPQEDITVTMCVPGFAPHTVVVTPRGYPPAQAQPYAVRQNACLPGTTRGDTDTQRKVVTSEPIELVYWLEATAPDAGDTCPPLLDPDAGAVPESLQCPCFP